MFAEGNHLPVIPENCPACFEAPKVEAWHMHTCSDTAVRPLPSLPHSLSPPFPLPSLPSPPSLPLPSPPSLSPPFPSPPPVLHQERHRMKQLLAAQELVFPRLFASLQAAMKPLMSRSTTGLESNRYMCVW